MKGREATATRTFTRRRFIQCVGGMAAGCMTTGLFEKLGRQAFADSRPWVVSVRDSRATSWNHSSGYHWEFIDQEVVNAMVGLGVRALTGTTDVADAWGQLVPYAPGDAVAIKINLNNSETCGSSNQMDAYPETVNAVIEGLKLIGVPSDRIWVTDPSRVIPLRFIERIADSGVRFYYAYGGCSVNSFTTSYVSSSSTAATPTTYPPGEIIRPAQVFVDAAHLINIPLLKGHGGAGVTLGLKNHYGSVMFAGDDEWGARERMHSYLYESLNPDPSKTVLGDINSNPHIRAKTRLILGDGLFGNPVENISAPTRWKIFNDQDANILFFGTDPVATDAVMCDFIDEERRQIGYAAASRAYLLHAQELALGVYDHWRDFLSKEYDAIFYRYIDGSGSDPAPSVTTLAASAVTSTSAVLNGNLQVYSAEGADACFEFGLSADYGFETPQRHVVQSGAVSEAVGSLQPDTVYHFRAMAFSLNGTAYGQDVTFRTLTADGSGQGNSQSNAGGGGGGGCFIDAAGR